MSDDTMQVTVKIDGKDIELRIFKDSNLGQALLEAATPHLAAIKCSDCGRARTVGTAEHRMDAYDYTPMQAITGQPLGWYSGDDGEVCPECMTMTMRR